MSNTIGNPKSALAKTSDFTTGTADNGVTHVYPGKEVHLYRADGAITKGKVVQYVAPTTTAPLSVEEADAANSHLTAGIAEASAVAGDLVPVCVYGNTFGVLGGTVTAGGAVGGAADADIEAVTIAAGTLVGAVLGFALAAGDSTDTVPIFVQRM